MGHTQWQPREWAETYVREVATTPHHSPQFQALAEQLTALGAEAREQLNAGAPPAEAQAVAALSQATFQLAAYMQRLEPQPQRRWPFSWWQRLSQSNRQNNPAAFDPAALNPAQLAAASKGANPLLMALYRAQDELRHWLLNLRAERERLHMLQETLALAATTVHEVTQLLAASLNDLRMLQPLHAAATEELLRAARQQSRDLSEASALAQHSALALAALEQEQQATLRQSEQAAEAVVLTFQLARQAEDMQALAEALARAQAALSSGQQSGGTQSH